MESKSKIAHCVHATAVNMVPSQAGSPPQTEADPNKAKQQLPKRNKAQLWVF